MEDTTDGAEADTRASAATSSVSPEVVKSRPLLLTSTVRFPAARVGTAHSSAVDDSHVACTSAIRPKRHVGVPPRAKPEPWTVTAAFACSGTRVGVSASARGPIEKRKSTEPCVKSTPLADACTRERPGDCAGA